MQAQRLVPQKSKQSTSRSIYGSIYHEHDWCAMAEAGQYTHIHRDRHARPATWFGVRIPIASMKWCLAAVNSSTSKNVILLCVCVPFSNGHLPSFPVPVHILIDSLAEQRAQQANNNVFIFY